LTPKRFVLALQSGNKDEGRHGFLETAERCNSQLLLAEP
jgi:hypothetical protein